MANLLSTKTCRKRLATLWFSGGLALFVVVVGQSFGGKFGDHADEAFSWFLPTLLPTLSLILGVLVIDANNQSSEEKQVDSYLFVVTAALSAMYLLLVAATLLLQPLLSVTPLILMKRSNLFLGPLQGLVSASIGAFFVKSEHGEPRPLD